MNNCKTCCLPEDWCKCPPVKEKAPEPLAAPSGSAPSLTPETDIEHELSKKIPEDLYRGFVTYAFARKLERERDSLKEVIGSMQNEILTLRDALEKIADIELNDNGDPWSSLEAIGAISHNAIHHPQNAKTEGPAA